MTRFDLASIRKFLHQFFPRQFEQVRNTLPTMAMKLRLCLEPKLERIVFRMDATTHEQYANKMEGGEWNYKKIKCLKQGMDFYHFPCRSLKANKVWGLMGIMAYNLMRVVSFTISKKGCFVDTVRRKVVLMAGEFIKSARYLEIRLMDYILRSIRIA
jgi:hypothetical protein